MLEAASMNSESASKLAAFLQNDQEDGELGAPAGTVYEGHSDGIIGTMQDLYEKAEAQLEKARAAETKSVQAYQMLAQSLKDEIKYGTKDMDKAKKDLGASDQAKATAEGDLAVTSKDLAEDVSTLSTLHQDCMKGAEDFEAETKSRGEELKALATAKKVIAEAVLFVRDLAQKQKSTALAQLASRMAQAMHVGGRSREDIFAKVKGL